MFLVGSARDRLPLQRHSPGAHVYRSIHVFVSEFREVLSTVLLVIVGECKWILPRFALSHVGSYGQYHGAKVLPMTFLK